VDLILKELQKHILETHRKRKSKGLCCSILHHGPGHQSKTFCSRKGKHTVHSCVYGSYENFMEWNGKEAFTGYFDKPKEPA